ncbi:MAG: phytanoyl-CoA dioxygenase family protein [Spirochaetaceae bacterium]|nr:phytanoyl-CoA dioxygenase family protein [Spirochaetaceae bacterium]
MAGDIAELRDRYRRDGFAIARGLFDAALLSEVAGELERVVAEAAVAGEHVQVYFDAEAPGSPVRCLFRIEEQSELLRDLLGSPLLLDVVRPLLEDEPVADGIQYIDKPPHATYRFPYHQDNAYQFYDPPRSLAATLALDAQGQDSGPISLLRGSHALPILPHEPSGVLGASRGLVDPPDTARYPEVAATVEAGDVLVHHTNVIHRTGPNLTGSHRRNLGFTYHGAGAAQDTEANAASVRMVERYNRSHRPR